MNETYKDVVFRLASGQLFRMLGSIPDRTMPSFKKPPFWGLADEVIKMIIEVFLEIKEDSEIERSRYQLKVQKILEETAREIREGRQYRFFADFIGAIEARFNLPFPEYLPDLVSFRPTIPNLLFQTLTIIWILLEKDGRFPAIIGDRGYQGRKIFLPEEPEKKAANLFVIGHQILAVLPWLGKKDLDLVPERFAILSQGEKGGLGIPIPTTTVPETLEDAYFHQRYVPHPVGAPVRIGRAGDIKGVFVKVRSRVVIGKFTTEKGDILCLLDLETGQGVNFFQAEDSTQPRDSLSRILASVYHALVVAVEKPSPRTDREEIELDRKYPLADGESLGISYIPRTIYVGAKKETAAPRTAHAFHRPPRVHPVRGHPRRAEMSSHQRVLIEQFERETGLSILDKIPPGHTWVRPHFSPAVENEAIVAYPLFIKKRVEAELIGATR